MSALTKEFLENIGIQMDDATYEAFAAHFDETLHGRVIESVIDALDDEKLAEYNQMQDASNDKQWQWLQVNVPELGDIIKDEIDILLGELAENADHI